MILVDTNVLLAAADLSAPEHTVCASILEQERDLATTAPVAVETAWMIESRLGPDAEATFLTSLADGELPVVDLTADDWRRSAELVATYRDMRLGLVDASLVAVAERLGVCRIATLNRRDFSVVRPRHCEALDLLP